MNSIHLLIANASGTLTPHRKKIENAFNKASKISKELMNAEGIDVIVVDASDNVIPELGVGGYTPCSYIVYISLDSKFDISENDIFMGMIHEMHHAMRWRNPGYGTTLHQALLTEGLATLFEAQVSGEIPIYATIKVSEEQISLAKQQYDSDTYDHYMWFIAGNDEISRWFGYAYGYQLAENLSKNLGKTAAELVHIVVKHK